MFKKIFDKINRGKKDLTDLQQLERDFGGTFRRDFLSEEGGVHAMASGIAGDLFREGESQSSVVLGPQEVTDAVLQEVLPLLEKRVRLVVHTVSQNVEDPSDHIDNLLKDLETTLGVTTPEGLNSVQRIGIAIEEAITVDGERITLVVNGLDKMGKIASNVASAMRGQTVGRALNQKLNNFGFLLLLDVDRFSAIDSGDTASPLLNAGVKEHNYYDFFKRDRESKQAGV